MGVKAADGDPRVLGSRSVHSQPWVAAPPDLVPHTGSCRGHCEALVGSRPSGDAASSKAQAGAGRRRGGVEGAEAQSR